MYAPHPHRAPSIDRSAETRIPYRTVLRSIGSLAVAAVVLAGISAGARRAAAAPSATAANATAPLPARPSDAPLPSCMDETIKDELGRQVKPKGVQRRYFLKKHKLELVAHGGLYSGDLTSSSWIAGGSLAWFFTEDFAVEARFDVTPIRLDIDQPLGQFFGDTHFKPGTGYLALGNLLWSPIHAKLKMAGGIVHSDIMVSAGAGRLIHDSVQGVTYDAGVSLELFTTRWVTFRFDARDVMAVQEAVAETRFTNNIVATAGIAFWIPL
jgi:outer membrane beta-barrel protein